MMFHYYIKADKKFIHSEDELWQLCKDTRIAEFMKIKNGLISFKERYGAEICCNLIEELSKKQKKKCPILTVVIDTYESLEKIVRVLTYQGYHSLAPADLKKELKEIGDRYSELRSDINFSDAALQSKLEWLIKTLKK